MTRLFSAKPLVWALATGFAAASGSLMAAPALPGGAHCRSPDAAVKTQLIAAPDAGQSEVLAPGDTRLEANRLSGQSQTRVRADGAVVMARDNLLLNADWVDYQQQTQQLQAGEAVTLADGNSRIRGRSLSYNLATRSGEADDAVFEIDNQGRRLQGVGDKVHIAGDGRYRLEKTQFNTCDAGDNSWYIEADSIDADYQRNIGVARHAKLKIGGVPLLYTPWIDFPLNGERKSGLLAPLVKAGSDGVELATPYYFNLAPNRDFTLRPHWIARRGLKLGGEFRYLQPRYAGSVQGDWLPDDRASRHNNRYKLDWRHQHRFSDTLSGGIDFHRVSDDDYYRDLMGSSADSKVNLNRQLWLSHDARLWGGRISSYFTVQKYQNLASASGYRDPPYALLPQLSSQWRRHFGSVYSAQVLAQASRFTHSDRQEGSRWLLYPSISADYRNRWGFVRPKLGLHATHYALKAWGGEPARSRNRVLPIFSVDSGVTFERPGSWRGHPYVQTLEPRLFYTYIPQRDQRQLPLFDASENSFDYAQLFQENRFSGQDRINTANFLTAAVQTRFYDGKNGVERLSAGVGQRYYFNRDDVVLDGRVQKNPRRRSDVLAFVRGRLSEHWQVNGSWHYNENRSASERYDAGFHYRPQEDKTVSMRYRFGRLEDIGDGNFGRVRQIDAALQWPLNRNLSLLARQNYDLTHSRSLQRMLGLEYHSPCRCWRMSVVGQRYVSGLNRSKNAVFFQLQLRDLTHVGSGPFEQLRTAIPGYRSINKVEQE